MALKRCSECGKSVPFESRGTVATEHRVKGGKVCEGTGKEAYVPTKE